MTAIIFRFIGILTTLGAIFLIYLTLEKDISSIIFVFIGLCQLLSVLFKMGIDDRLLKYSADAKNDKSQQRDFELLLNFSPLILLFILTFLTIAINIDSQLIIRTNINLFILTASAIFYTFNSSLSIILQGRGYLKLSVLSLQILPNIIIMFFLIYTEVAFLYFQVIFFASYLISFIFNIICLWCLSLLPLSDESSLRYTFFPSKADIQKQRTYYLNSLSTLSTQSLPILIVGYFFNADFSSDFSFSFRLCQSLFAILILVNFVFAPDVRRKITSGRISEAFTSYKYYRKLSGLLAIAGFLMLNITLRVMNNFIPVEMEFVQLMALILSAGIAVNVSFGPIGMLFIMTDNEKMNTHSGLLVLVAVFLGTIIISYLQFEVILLIYLSTVYSLGKIYLHYKLNSIKSGLGASGEKNYHFR